MKKRVANKISKKSALRMGEQSFKYGDAKFTFENEDIYNGGYKLHYGQNLLVKQGRGVYTTDNFDVYDGEWDDDTFGGSDIHIRYNNDSQYRGKVDSNGMNGRGTYTFPDGSSIEAIWLDNKPLTDIIFREPLGFTWIVENMTENGILFSRGNHFWNELSDQSHAHSTESLGQNESIIDESNETKNDI